MFKRMHNLNLKPNATQGEIEVGDYVLVEKPHIKGKLEYKMDGPFEVINKAREEATVRSLIGKKREKRVRFDRLSKFKHDNMITDPKVVVMKKGEEFNVEKIIRYIGDITKPKTLRFEVQWEGYPNSEDNTLEPIQHLKKNSIFIDFCKTHKNKRIQQLVQEKI